MKYLILLSTLLISGCWETIPSKPDWPAPPNVQICTDLLLVADGTEKLSETLSVITKNYGKYHECKATVEAWSAWYIDQKKIYEEAK